MPSSPCGYVDPVEMLLRSILRRASLLAGSSSLAACVAAVELDAGDSAQLDAARHDVNPPANAHFDAGTVQPRSEAGADVQLGPDYDAGGPDAAALADAACGNYADASASFDSTPPGPALSCSWPNLPLRAEALKLAQPFDYVALRRATPVSEYSDGGWSPGVWPAQADAGGEAWTHTNFVTLSESGQACATSTGPVCAQTIAKHPTSDALSRPCGVSCADEYSIVTTRGDEVRRWWIVENEMRTLLGVIDSPDDALLLLRAFNYQLTCGDAQRTSIRATADGYEAFATSYTSHCGESWFLLSRLHISSSGVITTLSSRLLDKVPCCAGRKPAGLHSEARDLGASQLGDFLARCAHLEAASVVSFERLEAELTAHGAPSDLIEAARAARADEVRHAVIVGQLARARGGEPVEPSVEALPIRTLEEIALENSVEGCVRETFAALIAGYQAQHARDRELREAIIGIAEDELRHAILAHRVERWISGELDAPALARVAQAKRRAVRELVRQAGLPIAVELQRSAGLPSTAVACALAGELAHSLWTRVASRAA